MMINQNAEKREENRSLPGSGLHSVTCSRQLAKYDIVKARARAGAGVS